MKHIRIFFFGFALPYLLLFSSCAGGYELVKPQHIVYETTQALSDITISYKYNVLEDYGNKKYAKKERKKGLQLVALKVVNHSSDTLVFSRDIQIFANKDYIIPIESEVMFKQFKQHPFMHLLYSLIWVNFSNGDQYQSRSIPVPVGLFIGVGNLGIAASANKKFMRELYEFKVLHRKIAPGETAFGLFGMRDMSYAPLSFNVHKDTLIP